ncbi:MAG: hypothetical protein O2856_18145 [Planctomycetota bacterium]|nr:hypothetical protein [Planctomycetota bacterium]
MTVSRSLTILVLLCTALRHVACPQAHADEQTPTPEQLDYFEKQVRPMNSPSASSFEIPELLIWELRSRLEN